MRIGARLAVLSLSAWVTIGAVEPVAPSTPPVDSVSPVSAEVAALAAAQGTVMTLSGDFRWLTENIGGEIHEKVGIFALQRGQDGAPTKYNVRISEADNSDVHRWCANGVGQWEIEQTVEDEPPTVRQVRPGMQDLDLNRVVACVLLDLPRLRQEFTIVLETTAAGRSLVFTPSTAALQEQLTRIVVILDGHEPHEVIIEDAHNARIRLVMKHLVTNGPVVEAFFTPVPPAPATK